VKREKGRGGEGSQLIEGTRRNEGTERYREGIGGSKEGREEGRERGGGKRGKTHGNRMPNLRKRHRNQMHDRYARLQERDMIVLYHPSVPTRPSTSRNEETPLLRSDFPLHCVVRLGCFHPRPEETGRSEALFGVEELVEEPAGCGEEIPYERVGGTEKVEEDEVGDPTELRAWCGACRGGGFVRFGPLFDEVSSSVDRVRRSPILKRFFPVEEHDLKRLPLSFSTFLPSLRFNPLPPPVKPGSEGESDVEKHRARGGGIRRADETVFGWVGEVLRVEMRGEDEAARGGRVVGED
jgi:hypothetical protein